VRHVDRYDADRAGTFAAAEETAKAEEEDF
jgi:hypothetical protein